MFEEKETYPIALAIAHHIMEGATWQEAREIVAEDVVNHSQWPNADEIESTLRSELYFLDPDHPEILQTWRKLALWVMQRIDFPLYLTGSVLNGSATVYTNLRLATFTDDTKAVEIALMQSGFDYEVIEPEIAKPQAQIAYGWLIDIPSGCLFLKKDKYLRKVGVRLEVFSERDLFIHRYKKAPDKYQCALEANGRISIDELKRLINTPKGII